MTIIPRRLPTGGVVGLWAPSFPAPFVFPARTTRAMEAVERAGFRAQLAPSFWASHGLTTAPPDALARELCELLTDPEVDAVLCAAGGWTVSSILPHLDFQALRAHPKPIIGYSDITALLLAVYAQAGMVSFHGPMLLSEWGEHGGPWDYTLEHFLRCTTRTTPLGRLSPPDAYTDELLWWDREDSRRRRLTGSGSWRFVKPGRAEGPLIGGCMPTVNLLIGTRFFPDPTGAVLFLEAEELTPDRFLAYLLHLKEAGILDRINGLIVGRHARPKATATGYADFDQVVNHVLGNRNIPVLLDVDLGHTEPMLTLPIGVCCRLDAAEGTFALLEPAVQ